MEMTKIFCELLSLSILFISGGVRMTSSQGPNDVVANSGDNVVFTYIGDATTGSSYYYWAVYEPQQQNIYTNGDTQTMDPSKYSVFNNGSFSLAISGVTTNDARTYCFYSAKTEISYCANLVVMSSIVASVNPPFGASVGQSVILNCLLQYGSPTSSSVRPLSPGQNPQLSMFIGTTQITGIPPGQITYRDQTSSSESINFNRTISSTDAGQGLTCVVSTTNPAFQLSSGTTPLNTQYATNVVNIGYTSNTTNNSSMKWCCRVNDVLNCTANGYPYPNITWKNEMGQAIEPLWRGHGFSSLQLERKGKYALNCTARNPMSAAELTQSITVDTTDGASGSLSIHIATWPNSFLWLIMISVMMASEKLFA